MAGSPVYVITARTKAIIAKDSRYYRSRILEQSKDKERFSIHKPDAILAYNCVVYGASLEGRRNATERMLKTRIKLPISVSTDHNIYMFPTASIRKKDCIWLSYYHIYHYEQRDDMTYVTFRDGSGLFVNTSERIIDMQFKKTSQVIAQMKQPPLPI